MVAWSFVVLGGAILDVGGRQARYSPSCRGLVSVVSDEVLNSAEAADVPVDMLGGIMTDQSHMSLVFSPAIIFSGASRHPWMKCIDSCDSCEENKNDVDPSMFPVFSGA